MRLILRIALDTPLRRLFDYLAPADVAATDFVPGKRIRVPFGRRRLTGMLMEVAERSAVPPHKLKATLEILDTEPLLDSNLLGFLEWAAEYYHHPIGEVIAAALPLPLRSGRPAEPVQERWQPTAVGRESGFAQLGNRAPRQRAILQRLLSARCAHGIRACRDEPSLAGSLAPARAQELGRIGRNAARQRRSRHLGGPRWPNVDGCSVAGRSRRAAGERSLRRLVA